MVKVTKEQVEYWLGTDFSIDDAIEMLTEVANGEYDIGQMKIDILILEESGKYKFINKAVEDLTNDNVDLLYRLTTTADNVYSKVMRGGRRAFVNGKRVWLFESEHLIEIEDEIEKLEEGVKWTLDMGMWEGNNRRWQPIQIERR